MISAEEFAEFKKWKTERSRPKLSEMFAEIRQILAAEGEDGIELSPRINRYNPMVDDPQYWDEPTEAKV